MRISDWSSDVCSSDLCADGHPWLRTPCPPSPDSTILRSILGVDTCHPRPHSSGRRGSGRVDHYRNVPAILSNMAPRPHTVAAVITHGVSPFELSVACEVFGLDRSELVDPWRSAEHTSELQSLMRISY